MLVSQAPFGLLEELNGILDALKLSTAGYGDHGVLNWIQLEVQLLNHFLVHLDEFITISTSIKSSVLYISQ